MAVQCSESAFNVLGQRPQRRSCTTHTDLTCCASCYHAGVVLYNTKFKKLPLRTFLW